MTSHEIQVHYDYYCLCFPQSFIPNFFFLEEELSVLDIHQKKGYSNQKKNITEILLFRNLFLKTLVKSFFFDFEETDDFNVHKMVSWLLHFSAKNFVKDNL